MWHDMLNNVKTLLDVNFDHLIWIILFKGWQFSKGLNLFVILGVFG
jgi:hypothetical protein